MAEDRYCSNCRAEVPQNATSCPACGVFAGDVFDGRVPRRRRASLIPVLSTLLILVAAISAWLVLRREPSTPPAPVTQPAPPRVVGDRPGTTRRGAGATMTEPEAILTLRRYLVAQRALQSNCIAILSNGYKDGHYTFTAVNHCEGTRLGRFRVNGKTREVLRGWR